MRGVTRAAATKVVFVLGTVALVAAGCSKAPLNDTAPGAKHTVPNRHPDPPAVEPVAPAVAVRPGWVLLDDKPVRHGGLEVSLVQVAVEPHRQGTDGSHLTVGLWLKNATAAESFDVAGGAWSGEVLRAVGGKVSNDLQGRNPTDLSGIDLRDEAGREMRAWMRVVERGGENKANIDPTIHLRPGDELTWGIACEFHGAMPKDLYLRVPAADLGQPAALKAVIPGTRVQDKRPAK